MNSRLKRLALELVNKQNNKRYVMSKKERKKIKKMKTKNY